MLFVSYECLSIMWCFKLPSLSVPCPQIFYKKRNSSRCNKERHTPLNCNHWSDFRSSAFSKFLIYSRFIPTFPFYCNQHCPRNLWISHLQKKFFVDSLKNTKTIVTGREERSFYKNSRLIVFSKISKQNSTTYSVNYLEYPHNLWSI